jgi:hypothetical protein
MMAPVAMRFGVCSPVVASVVAQPAPMLAEKASAIADRLIRVLLIVRPPLGSGPQWTRLIPFLSSPASTQDERASAHRGLAYRFGKRRSCLNDRSRRGDCPLRLGAGVAPVRWVKSLRMPFLGLRLRNTPSFAGFSCGFC